MADFIVFFLVVAVKMIDPISLLIAVPIGFFAASKDGQERAKVIAFGTITMVIALTSFIALMDSSTGLNHSSAMTGFALMTGAAAAALQIGLTAWGITAWRNRRERLASAEKVEPRA